MSSISAADRSNANDEVRRVREEYERQEAESAKRKNREVRALTEKYDKDLTEVTDSYDHQLAKTREKNSEVIEDRDRRHAEDVAKVRQTYVESMRRKADDESRDRQAMKLSHESEVNKLKDIGDQQLKTQQRNFGNVIREKDRASEDNEQHSIVGLQDKLKDRVQKLNHKHEEEVRELTKIRDGEKQESSEKYEILKGNDRDRFMAKERMDRDELASRVNAFETSYRNQEHDNSYLLDTQGKELKEENSHLRELYKDKYDKDAELMAKMRDHYANEIENRTGGQIRSAQAEMSRARNEQVLDSINNRRLRDLDHHHLERASEDRIKDLEKQKNQVYDVVNDENRAKINTVIDRTNKLLAETDRRTKMQQNVLTLKNKEAVNQTEQAYEDQLATVKTRTDSRIRNIVRTTDQSQKASERQHEIGLEALKKDYSENLQNQREASLETMKQTYSRMEQRLRDLEVNWMKKHDALVEFYEGKTQDLQEKSKEEIQRQAQMYEQRSNIREKGVKQEEDSIEQKYQQRAATQEELHRKELERMEKRHQEQMQALASRVNAAAKKA
jgi:hypothetical protein